MFLEKVLSINVNLLCYLFLNKKTNVLYSIYFSYNRKEDKPQDQ